VRFSNDPRFLTALVPAGNMVATAREAATFFELLRRGGRYGEKRIFDARTVRRAIGESSWLEVDLTVVLPIRYSLGLVLGSEHVSLYGPDTPNAFGHLGFINVLCWADPDRELSAALLTSGKPFVGAHLGAMVKLLGTISRRLPPTHGLG
jgi:CubicO group peptidase (beta-lactamase class C family)